MATLPLAASSAGAGLLHPISGQSHWLLRVSAVVGYVVGLQATPNVHLEAAERLVHSELPSTDQGQTWTNDTAADNENSRDAMDRK
jgi:hypothetical protein